MILVFFLVLIFLWGYLKKFPQGSKLRMILIVTVFSVLVSFLVSFITVYSYWSFYDTDKIDVAHVRYNPTLARLSLPFYFEGHSESLRMSPPHKLWEWMYVAGVQLWEMEFQVDNWAWIEGRLAIHPPDQPNVNYTVPLFYQMLLVLTPLNMIGAPLAVLIYKLATTKLMRKIVSKISNFEDKPVW